MSALYVMIPVALLLAGAAVAAFYWAVRNGQFDDPDSDACRLLFDDDDTPAP
jgi:cbb3-type cytochrome oxidase maturation protein